MPLPPQGSSVVPSPRLTSLALLLLLLGGILGSQCHQSDPSLFQRKESAPSASSLVYPSLCDASAVFYNTLHLPLLVLSL